MQLRFLYLPTPPLLILMLGLTCGWSACGPADPEALGPVLGEPSSSQARTSALVGQAWSGFQLRKEGHQKPGLALTTTEVALNFFDDRTFKLTLPSKQEAFIKGTYDASPQTINLTVNDTNVDNLGRGGLRNTFHYTLKNNRLHLYNQKLEFSLAASPKPEQGSSAHNSSSASSGEQSSASSSLFDSWTCQAPHGGLPWRITIFSDQSFQLRSYLKEGAKLVTSTGQLSSYSETPSETARLQFPSVRRGEPILSLSRSSEHPNKAIAQLFAHGQISQPSQSFDCLRL